VNILLWQPAKLVRPCLARRKFSQVGRNRHFFLKFTRFEYKKQKSVKGMWGMEKKSILEEIKQTDLVNHLSSLGYEPVKVRGASYWYLSPLRQEKTASFKVNRKLNRWWDFGLGQGGSIIDFGILYHQCSVGDFIRMFRENPKRRNHHKVQYQDEVLNTSEEGIIILKIKPLFSTSLLHYLSQRKIPVGIADRFCQEVVYQLCGKEYYAIGFANDAGGYELRNPFTKLSSSPKDITSIGTGSQEVAVFEGFFDLLSFLVAKGIRQADHLNLIVLNSLSFFERARPLMEAHRRIHLYLDRDASGRQKTREALFLSDRYVDKSYLYQNYKDLNEWLVQSGLKKRLALELR